MLCERQGTERAIESASSLCNMALLQQEGQIVDPDAGHFVEKDQGTLEAIVDFFVLCPVSSRIEGRNVFNPKIKILL